VNGGGAADQDPAAGAQILWVGSEGGMEADLVKRAGVPYTAIPAAGVHGVGWRALPGNVYRLWRGLLASRRILNRFRPDVLFFTGGYLGVPMALAGRFGLRGGTRPRSLVFVPDIEPGLALKTLARLADQIATTVEASREYLPSRAQVIETGYPTRPDLAGWTRSKGRELLRLSADIPVLLVAGGSRGARSINKALLGVLPELLGDMQVIHISGMLDWPEVEEAYKRLQGDLPESHFQRYRPYPYLHAEMGAALAAADLAFSRAGASCLGEYPLFGLPAILVPYPYAWRYQSVNARYLEERGAAMILKDADLPAQLLPVVSRLISDRSALGRMREAMSALAQPQAAHRIAAILSSMAVSERGAA